MYICHAFGIQLGSFVTGCISSWAPQIFGLILNLHTEISTLWCTILWISTKAYNHIPTATISYRAVLSIPSASLWHPWFFATPWMVAYQAPWSMGFSRQEYWMGCHFLLQGIFPTQGLNPGLLHCRQMLLLSEPPVKPLIYPQCLANLISFLFLDFCFSKLSYEWHYTVFYFLDQFTWFRCLGGWVLYHSFIL